jgi:putative aldouronate transport system substrate-binding protein
MKKVLILMLAVSLIAMLFTACGQEKVKEKDEGGTEQVSSSTQKENDNETTKSDILNEDASKPSNEVIIPIVKEPVTMSFVVNRPVNGGSTEDLWFWKWLETKGNIKADVKQIDSTSWEERKQIMFASDSLPEVFLHCTFSAEEIVRYGQVEGQLIPMNDLIEQYAPNIKQLFEKSPEIRTGLITADGNIYHLPAIDDTVQYAHRTWIHYSWVDELGLKDPETLDELYDVLKAFKEKDSGIIPFSGSWYEEISERIMILSALGFATEGGIDDLSVKDGKVVFPALEDTFKEYLGYLNKLYSEELMDRDIFTQTQVQANAKSAQGIVGLATNAAPFIMDPERWEEYEALRPLTSKWNNKPMWPTYHSIKKIGSYVISNNCKYPEVAMRFADMFFTDQSRSLFWEGPNRDYEKEYIIDPERNGWWATEDGQMSANYTEDINTAWDYNNMFMNPINNIKLGLAWSNDVVGKRYNFEVKFPPKAEAWRVSMNERVISHYVNPFPRLYLTEQDIEKSTQLATPIIDYIEMMEAKFITGNEPLENFDVYQKELKNLGIEEYIEIFQRNYDNYAKNMK